MTHMRAWPSRFLIYVSCLLAAGDASAQISKDTKLATCDRKESCEIHYDHLSSQDTEPFRFGGKVINKDSPRWREFRRSIQKYQSVEDCPGLQAQEGNDPAWLSFDWRAVGSTADLQVCLFRIAASLDGPSEISKWLSVFGFENLELLPLFADGHKPLDDRRPVIILSSSIKAARYLELRPNLIHTLFGISLLQGAGVIMSWDEAGSLAGANISITVE
ncbi:hypothetical protein [Defluviimonas salinarum]|uniref:Uncharacterized protein n=1 Tax=Defluviimonas salinarum TaxID=2992147 RepID=A0ABT3J878_9RHOB|nr:hypothetical protein [Defluviimonas salinarum]MCW3783892.1 hypothetical protein [Defluviimonas salinarum]